jgi:tetratricopeptide (TPR) repeat protein
VAELFETAEAPESDSSSPVQTENAAVAIALDRARRRKRKSPAAADDEVDRFLAKQEALIDDQRSHLREQMRHMRLKHVSERLKVTGQFLTIGVGLAVAFGVGALLWAASRAEGVVIEAFSVPPDFEAHGLTGKVMAGRLQDKLSELQAQTRASRAAATYANDWGRDIKVEIPETGVSIGEVQRYLRQWLGRETHVTGDLSESPQGLTLSVRADGVAGEAVMGEEDKLDELVTAGALALYRKTQPYRWSAYMADHGHEDAAIAAARELAASGPPTERAWAMNMLRSFSTSRQESVDLLRKGIELDPNVAILWRNLAQEENVYGHVAEASRANRRALAAMKRPDHGGYSGASYFTNSTAAAAQEAVNIGDYASALRFSETGILKAPPPAGRVGQYGGRVRALAGLHRISEARAALAPFGDDAVESQKLILQANGGLGNITTFNALVALTAGDWDEALRQLDALELAIAAVPADFTRRRRIADSVVTNQWPLEAEALAHAGRIDEARTLAAKTPLDCYPCVRARAKVAALAGRNAEADHWFAEAERQAPAFVAAPTEWGEALLRRGDLDRAIDKLKAAHRLGPRFADPLELWGEALLARGQTQAAIAKFRQADRLATKWGRLHLRWAQALAKAGRTDEARAQLKMAAALDLTPSEKSELAGLKL